MKWTWMLPIKNRKNSLVRFALHEFSSVGQSFRRATKGTKSTERFAWFLFVPFVPFVASPLVAALPRLVSVVNIHPLQDQNVSFEVASVKLNNSGTGTSAASRCRGYRADDFQQSMSHLAN